MRDRVEIIVLATPKPPANRLFPLVQLRWPALYLKCSGPYHLFPSFCVFAELKGQMEGYEAFLF